MKIQQVRTVTTFGADPEFFLLNAEGELIGSHEKIPPEGYVWPGYGRVVRDGVQVEIQVKPNYCRQVFTQNFTYLMKYLRGYADVSLQQAFVLTPEQLQQMPLEARVLGCQPSMNIYGPRPIDVGVDFPLRTAGGHIHLGSVSKINVERLVGLMDLLVGIPATLLDRDPSAAERREVYGRAGEYRIQPHGMEYRTLSNFWFRHPVLIHFILGMARFAHVVNHGYQRSELFPNQTEDIWAPGFLKQFNPDEVQKAINESDFDLALQIYERVEEWINLNVETPPWTDYPPRFALCPLEGKGAQKAFRSLIGGKMDKVFPKNFAIWEHAYQEISVSEHFMSGWEKFVEKGGFNDE